MPGKTKPKKSEYKKADPLKGWQQIAAFLGHFASDEDRRKFSHANAAALYGLEL